MASYNRVIIIGNLTKDPELKRTPSGAAVCDLRIAVNDAYRNKKGERIERPLFVDVVVWNQQAEFCNQYLTKGSPLFVEGRLQYEEWKTAQGESRNRLRIVASRTQFLGAPPGQNTPAHSTQTTGSTNPSRETEQSNEADDVQEPDSDDEIPF